MARTLNVETHAVRREAFVDAAMRLMTTKGYVQMSIQDVLDAVGASRGAFYHYFDSKQALLEAITDRIADQALAQVAPAVNDSSRTAVSKLEAFFVGIAQYKTERKALMLEFIKVWRSDDNAIAREHLRHAMIRKVAAVMERIVEQGVAEEVFAVESPAETALILMTFLIGFQDEATDLFLARQANTISYEDAVRTMASFTSAFERILGAPRGSIHMADESTLREWFG